MFWAPQTSVLPTPEGLASAQGVPVASQPPTQPPSQHQPAPASTSRPSSQPARCHPVRQKPNPKLLKAPQITLQASKTFENQRLPSPEGLASAQGDTVASQPPSHHQPPPASPPASQPSAIQCASNSIQSSSKPPELPSSLPSALKIDGFQLFLLCQSSRLQHQFWMPKSSQLTPSDLQRQSGSSQAHPKWSLEAPKMSPNTPIWSHDAQSEPNLNPGAPKDPSKDS